MGDNPRRPAFRLRWGDSGGSDAADKEKSAAEPAAAPSAPAQETPAPAPTAEAESPPPYAPAAEREPVESSPFLRDLVDAMRSVAESSRDANLGDARMALEKRLEQLRSEAAERAEDLRRRSELDLTSIGDWERGEIERVRAEAEQRREARLAELEKQLADHEAASDSQLETVRHRLADYERQLTAFFAELANLNDPAAFVNAVKRMPAAPDFSGSGARAGGDEHQTSAPPAQRDMPDAANAALTERLARLNQRLAEQDRASQPEASAEADAAETAQTPPEPPPADASGDAEQPAPTPAPPTTASANGETSTPIVVKGLGSFGAITSFKQALERVDGIRGVTLSLGPTGEFVYRASHAAEFDITAAIRGIEGPGAGIEKNEGSVLVTIDRGR